MRDRASTGQSGDLVILSISVDKEPSKARAFVERHKLAWRQTALGPIDTNPLARLYNVNSTPTLYLIDKSGRVVAKEIAGEDLESLVRKHTEKRSEPRPTTEPRPVSP